MLLVPGLLLAPSCLLAGCASAPADAGSPPGEVTDGDEGGELQLCAGPSPMLGRLRDANREAAIGDRRQDIREMRLELERVELELAEAGPSSANTVALENRRDNLRRTIANEERMLQSLGQ